VGEAEDAAARGLAAPGSAPDHEVEAPPAGARLRPRPGGVSVIAGGLLQDLEDRLRRDLAPIEERVRRGKEARGLVGEVDGPQGSSDPLVIVLPDRG
jgi:hypothetical protein